MKLPITLAPLAVAAVLAATHEAQALCAAPEIEGGRYVNVDPNARSITTASLRFVCGSLSRDNGNGTITIAHDADPHWRVALWGSCHPSDCEWGDTRGEIGTSGVVEGRYDQGFAGRDVLVLPSGDDILVWMRSTYADGREPRTSWDLLRRE